jgi:hypothetical protein
MICLPDWIPAEAWAEFKRMRKSIRKPMTEYAESLMIKRLKGFVDAGQDAQAILDQSIVHCWQTVYELKVEEVLQVPFSPAKLSVVPSRNGQAWNLSNEGIISKARQCGVPMQRGDTYEQIKDRVQQFIDDPRNQVMKHRDAER